ncbi:MAG: WD40/YVTN/BNR-like repeat-containing protein, partial [Flavobacteriales bacterium]
MRSMLRNNFYDLRIGILLLFLFCPFWGLSQWYSQTSGTSEALFSVHFVSSSKGWVAGWFGEIRTTVDSGNTWNAQNSGTSSGLTGMDFIDASNGWVVGE